MSRKERNASQRYHDRVAPQYDTMYEDAFWEFHDRVTWNHLKHYLPKTNAPAMDLGCGTGKWGLKLLKMGFPITFVDHSEQMLAQVREKLAVWAAQPDLASKAAKATVRQADALDLSAFPREHFALVVGMGDVVSICSDPAKCLGQVAAALQPGGMFVFTVDNALAAIDHFVETGNVDALAGFIKTGRTHWLTSSREEQFEVQMFRPSQIEHLAQSRGLDVLSRIGKTVIPARRNKKFFEKEGNIEQLVQLEAMLAAEPAALARASHIQIATRKRNTPANDEC
jgi:ubiquinone/menaquinone biosynthesis C-methylase UbiE